MRRDEFLGKTFRYGVISCTGISFMLSKKSFFLSHNINKIPDMDYNDEFLRQFQWITDMLNNCELTDYFETGSVENTIITTFKNGWGKRDTVELLQELSAEYGEKAGQAVEEFIRLNIIRSWPETGEREAHKGTEAEDFIRVLWEPLKELGFEFTINMENDIFTLRLTKCPVAELADKTNLHDWLYHMACVTDFYSTPAFSDEIGFGRTKTLMQKDEYCNHTYYYKKKVKTKDSLLGYCGLYCGGCPYYQNTVAVKPIDFKKENFYEPCEGCNSGIKNSYCLQCEIVKCNMKKGTRICYDCEKYPCEIINKFMNDSRYPYHKEVDDKMKLLKEKGLDQWLEIQESKYKCKNCGAIFNFFQKKCDKCGINL